MFQTLYGSHSSHFEDISVPLSIAWDEASGFDDACGYSLSENHKLIVKYQHELRASLHQSQGRTCLILDPVKTLTRALLFVIDEFEMDANVGRFRLRQSFNFNLRQEQRFVLPHCCKSLRHRNIPSIASGSSDFRTCLDLCLCKLDLSRV